MRFAKFTVIILLSSFSVSALAQAKGYLGGFAGMSVPDYDDTSARLAYGVLGGARLDGEWGFGGFFLSSSKEEEANGQKSDFNYNLYGIEGSYHFEGVADGAYFGARVGIAKVDIKATTTRSYSPMVWGIHLGYDYFFNDNASFGVEAGYMNVEKESSATKGDLKSFGMINFALTGKFWF